MSNAPIPAMQYDSMKDIILKEFATPIEELEATLPAPTLARFSRVREMVAWFSANPDTKDRNFVQQICSKYGIAKSQAYDDLKLVKQLLVKFNETTRDFHRWRFNEMILETYAMAKARKDMRTMEKAAATYAKYNRIDTEDETSLPFDMIVVQPFTATDDPAPLGITKMKDRDERVKKLLDQYGATNPDIQDVEWEDADLMTDEIFENYGRFQQEEE